MNKLLKDIIEKIIYNYKLDNFFLTQEQKTLFIKKFEIKSIYYMTFYINITIYQQLIEDYDFCNKQIPNYINFNEMENVKEIKIKKETKIIKEIIKI